MQEQDLKSVALVRCDNYTEKLLDDSIATISDQTGVSRKLNSAKILIKPNLISSKGPSLACTEGRFLAAVVRYCIENGAQVKIGDSPAFGTTESVLRKQQIVDCLGGLEYEAVNFMTPLTRRLSNGVEVKVAAEVFECDFMINLPRIKAHNQMYLTGAVKNFFGLVVGVRKAIAHMKYGNGHQQFSDILLRIPELVPDHFTIADCISVMHRQGPLDGDSLMVGCVAGSTCPVAIDTTMLDIFELSREKSPLWIAASKAGMSGTQSESITYPLVQPKEFYGSGFQPVDGLNSIRFSLSRLLVNGFRRLLLLIQDKSNF